jgi:N-acetylneuraminic acid mutarotase/phosphoribosylformylglycinamidine (FGAM) synthase PurS component
MSMKRIATRRFLIAFSMIGLIYPFMFAEGQTLAWRAETDTAVAKHREFPVGEGVSKSDLDAPRGADYGRMTDARMIQDRREPVDSLLERSRLHRRGHDNVRLPGGMDPMDVVRMVQRNRVRSEGRDSSVRLGSALSSAPYAGVHDVREQMGREPVHDRGHYDGEYFEGVTRRGVPGVSTHGLESEPAGALTPTDEVGSAFHIGGEPVYGTASRAQFEPAIGFDGTNYLVVWMDDRSCGFNIYGARVSMGGVVLDPGGIAISTAVDDQYYPSVGFDGTNYLVVWGDYRSESYSDIYGTRVSKAGAVLDPAGIAISTAANDQQCPKIAFDGTNYLVVWQDNRSGNWDIYGTRVSAGGGVLDPSGIAISTAANNQQYPKIAFDGTNYLVVWGDDRSGSSLDIYGTRVSMGGSVLDPSGIAISTGAQEEFRPAIAFGGTNYLVVWIDYRNGFALYGSRVSVGGVVLDTVGIWISPGASEPGDADVGFDGTNYLVVWEDDRSGIGTGQIYGARVSVGGSVLDPAAIAISTVSNGQWCPATAFGGTNYLVVWETDYDIYGSRVSVEGGVLDPGRVTISTVANSQNSAAIAFDGTNYLVVWEDDRSGDWDIYGTRVSAGGSVLDPSGIAISTAAQDQFSPAIAFDGTNYLVVWADTRRGNGTPNIYGARVSVGGSVLDTAGIVISPVPGDMYGPAIAFDGTNYLVVWEDYGDYERIHGARVSVGGSVLDPASIVISPRGCANTLPAIAFDGTNYLVVWQGQCGSHVYYVYGARVSVGGSVLDPARIGISTAEGYQMSPAIAFDGTNYLVTWQDRRSGNWDIYGARVSVGGGVLDPSGIAISTAANDQQVPKIAFDGTDYLVVWDDERNVYESYDIYGTRVDPAGTVLDSAGMPISIDADDQLSPAVTRGSLASMLIAYGSFTTDPVYDSYRIWGNFWTTGQAECALQPFTAEPTSLPSARRDIASASMAGRIYVSGGLNEANVFLDDVLFTWVSGDSLHGWVETAPLPDSVRDHRMVVVGDRLYVLGGNEGAVGTVENPIAREVHDQVYFASPSWDGTIAQWEQTLSLPKALWGQGAAVKDNRIYVVGGSNDVVIEGTPSDAVYSGLVDSETGHVVRWDTLTSLPEPLGVPSVVIHGDHIYVVGGVREGPSPGNASATVYVNQILPDGSLAGAWTTDRQLPEPRWDTGVVVVNSVLYVVGGYDSEGYSRRTVYYASVGSSRTLSEWNGSCPNALPLLPPDSPYNTGLSNFAMEALNCRFYVIGGYSWGTPPTEGFSDAVYSSVVPFCEVIGVAEDDGQPRHKGVGTRCVLEQNFPNPFNPVTTIVFSVAERTRVRLVVFDMAGRVVATILDRQFEAGRYSVPWDGKSVNGTGLSSGVYLLRLESGDFTATRKMVMLR